MAETSDLLLSDTDSLPEQDGTPRKRGRPRGRPKKPSSSRASPKNKNDSRLERKNCRPLDVRLKVPILIQDEDAVALPVFINPNHQPDPTYVEDIRIPRVQLVATTYQNTLFTLPPNYIRFTERTPEELQKQVEYDLDSEDERWLVIFNKSQAGRGSIGPGTFEELVDRFEKAVEEDQQDPTILAPFKADGARFTFDVSSRVRDYWLKKRALYGQSLFAVFRQIRHSKKIHRILSVVLAGN